MNTIRTFLTHLPLIIGLLLLGAVPVLAQTNGETGKIESAMSAGMPGIAADAWIFDWPSGENQMLTTLREGTNEWACLPDMPDTPGNDPMCVNGPALEWMIAYMKKEEPEITQPGIAYMFQESQDASNTDPYATEPEAGEDWIAVPPHIMVFPTDDLDPAVYPTDPENGGPWIMWSGTPYEHLMIPVTGTEKANEEVMMKEMMRDHMM